MSDFVDNLLHGKVKTVNGANGTATLNAYHGVVCTESLPTGANEKVVYTIINNHVNTGDIVLISLSSTSKGTPVVSNVSLGDGSFTVDIANVSTRDAFDAIIKISFVVVKG